MIRYNKRGGEFLFDKFKCFCPVFTELELKLDAENQKDNIIFTWKPYRPKQKEKPRPPGFQILYYVLGNQLQLHKTNKQNQANFSFSFFFFFSFSFFFSFFFFFSFSFSFSCFTRSFSLLPQTSSSLVTRILSKTLYKGQIPNDKINELQKNIFKLIGNFWSKNISC